MSWLKLLSFLAAWAYLAFTLATFAIVELRSRGHAAPDILHAIRAELRPFALPLLVLSYLPRLLSHMSVADWIFLTLSALFWLVYRHDKDDDDRWKRRRKKLAEKVSEVGGKLQVVPAGAS